ncbi:hypothetical protein [Sulfitobacter sp. D7]|uniref:hypothetical protein n=1 Tax=Sulfitobacter sp. D7 TaxID=1968541 RepID=UPI000E77A8A9|nr:hypothetical protein [Sulfitobacter sp. D7]AYE88267.1 hypothetical protein B5M07_18830 [Sulfitobacter sp. D7]
MAPPLEQTALAVTEAHTELQCRLQSVEEAAQARWAVQLTQEMRQREAVLARALIDSRQEGAALGEALTERDAAVAELAAVRKALAANHEITQQIKAELDQIRTSRLWRFTRFLRRADHS